MRVNENSWGAQILQFFWAFLIKQLFHSRLLDMRSLKPTRRYAPRWLSTISYPTRARGIIVKYPMEKRASDVILRQDSDKRSGMADDSNFLKHLLKQPMFLKHFLETKIRLDSLYFSQNTLVVCEPRGGIIIRILF